MEEFRGRYVDEPRWISASKGKNCSTCFKTRVRFLNEQWMNVKIQDWIDLTCDRVLISVDDCRRSEIVFHHEWLERSDRIECRTTRDRRSGLEWSRRDSREDWLIAFIQYLKRVTNYLLISASTEQILSLDSVDELSFLGILDDTLNETRRPWRGLFAGLYRWWRANIIVHCF